MKKIIPIIVGGTHYYVESILWENYLIENDNFDGNMEPGHNNNNQELPVEYTYEKLVQVDPVMAQKLHPNELRKIKRSLEIFEATGKRHSEIILDKQAGKELRFNPCVFWVSCDQNQLDLRLEKRTQNMLQKGLLEELHEFYQHHTPTDFTKGILQAIGCKEFYQYIKENPDLTSTIGLQECIDKFVQNTKRYSKVQLNWIRKLSTSLKVHKLDATDLAKWSDNVLNPAFDMLQDFLLNSSDLGPPSKIVQIPVAAWKRNICTLCDGRIFVNENQWHSHLKSKGHKTKQKRERKSLAVKNRNETVPKSFIENQNKSTENET